MRRQGIHGTWGYAAGLLATSQAAFGQCEGTPIDPPMAWAYGDFGYSIAVGPGELIVGDPFDDSLCPTYAGCNSGVVYAFEPAGGGGWMLGQRVESSDLAELDAFGRAMARRDQTLAVGATGKSTVEYGDGAAYTFERERGVWRQTAALLPPVFEQSSGFGFAAALVDDWAFIGQPHLNAPGMGDVGAVQVYRREGAEWNFFQSLTPPDPEIGMKFGGAVSADGDTLVVGAAPYQLTGAVYVYTLIDGRWTLEAQLTKPPESLLALGSAVAIEGDLIAAGARADGDPETAAGAVYIYQRDAGGAWKETARVQHRDPRRGDHLGESVALMDGALIAGAPDVGWGAAYVFRRDGAGAWRQVSKLEPPAGLGRSFGEAIAVGGGMVAVGDPVATVSGLPSVGRAFTFDLTCALCRVDVDGDGELTFFDFLVFQNLFAAGDMGADFDGSGALDFFDFLAFQDAFAAGCG